MGARVKWIVCEAASLAVSAGPVLLRRRCASAQASSPLLRPGQWRRRERPHTLRAPEPPWAQCPVRPPRPLETYCFPSVTFRAAKRISLHGAGQATLASVPSVPSAP